MSDNYAIRRLWREYRTHAAQRSLSFHLTFKCFEQLTGGPCFYCGAPPAQLFTHRKSRRSKIYKYLHTGIDRLDSFLGYSDTNCVGACPACNSIKGGSTVDDLDKRVNKLLDEASVVRNIAVKVRNALGL